ncbi:MAG: hypothetical protein FGM57_03775, partial [Candidatus Taylorbacteria bacterium]|nr:hypothetical protein [Candidatus Taylorbacteria bacterium]
MRPLNAHMLAFSKNAWKTRAGFTAMLKHVKMLGFSGIVIIPSLFSDELTKDFVTQTAREEKVKLITCGFRAKAPISPYTYPQGADAAIETFRGQFDWQRHFVANGVGDNIVCGPVLDDWGAGTSEYRSAGMLVLAQKLAALGKEMGLVVCAEIVNIHESGIVNPHIAIPGVIRKVNSPHLRLHADV